jgi:hypothetical protein
MAVIIVVVVVVVIVIIHAAVQKTHAKCANT